MNSSLVMPAFFPPYEPRSLGDLNFFHQPVTGGRIEIQTVNPLEIVNAATSLFAKRMATVKGVQHNPLQQISEGHVVILSQGFQHLEQALLDADAGLGSLDN